MPVQVSCELADEVKAVRASEIEMSAGGRARFTLTTPDGVAPVELNMPGEHHVCNALATPAVAYGLGLGPC